jgi:hypothetical protein
MKLSKILGVAAVAALALMAFASTASATTLETNGVKQSGAVTIEASLTAGTSAVLKDTSGAFANTCTTSKVEGTTSVFTGTTVSGPISTLSFTNCTHEKVEVIKAGSLSIESITGTTNGTVRSSGAEVKVPVTIFGGIVTATCTTNNTDIGTLTGTASHAVGAEMDINAVLNCGSFLPSAKWEGKYILTTPGTTTGTRHAIGVVS